MCYLFIMWLDTIETPCMIAECTYHSGCPGSIVTLKGRSGLYDFRLKRSLLPRVALMYTLNLAGNNMYSYSAHAWVIALIYLPSKWPTNQWLCHCIPAAKPTKRVNCKWNQVHDPGRPYGRFLPWHVYQFLSPFFNQDNLLKIQLLEWDLGPRRTRTSYW